MTFQEKYIHFDIIYVHKDLIKNLLDNARIR